MCSWGAEEEGVRWFSEGHRVTRRCRQEVKGHKGSGGRTARVKLSSAESTAMGMWVARAVVRQFK